jgi:hypothetical protein
MLDIRVSLALPYCVPLAITADGASPHMLPAALLKFWLLLHAT